MKQIKDLDIRKAVQGATTKKYSEGQNISIKSFILSVYSLYSTNQIGDATSEDNFVVTMLTYADDILAMKGAARQERLHRIKKLKQAGCKKYLWPEEALSNGTAEHRFFIHDYHSFYPPSPDLIGDKNKADRLENKGTPTTKDQANKNVNRLKGLF